jgi:probable addiction module antidote protein
MKKSSRNSVRESLGIKPFDAAEYLQTQEDMEQYFEACLQEGDPALVQHALGVIARARGMVQLAKDTGLSREGLYRSLSAEGNPEFATIMKVTKALGLSLHAGSSIRAA